VRGSCAAFALLALARFKPFLPCRLQVSSNGATATAQKVDSSVPKPVVKIDNVTDPFATKVRALRSRAVLAVLEGLAGISQPC
jgi:hypothetical protein